MKVDILAVGVHPDDVELGCGGTLVHHRQQGYTIGILDLTQGELGTRGNAALRLQEAEEAREILKAQFRWNAGFRDGFFRIDEQHLLAMIISIRAAQPRIVLCNAPSDRHPDHGRASQLTREACFLAGLPKIQTHHEGRAQEAWRPEQIHQYIQAYHHEPDFVVDISHVMDRKMEAVKAYSSQFYQAESTEPQTFISNHQFMEFVYGRASHFGVPAGFRYGEGFVATRFLGVKNLMDLY